MENKARKEQKSKKFSISGKTSRAQTPVSSTQSPVIVHQRVTRKTSNGSRHSRARSLSRLSNRLSTSSSDEGKLAFHYVVSNNRCTFLFISSDLFYSRLSCITNDVGKWWKRPRKAHKTFEKNKICLIRPFSKWKNAWKSKQNIRLLRRNASKCIKLTLMQKYEIFKMGLMEKTVQFRLCYSSDKCRAIWSN